MSIIHLIIALTAVVFFGAVVARFVRINNMPLHLRWELYPVPHEKGRSSYGGSILEEVNWWTKKSEKDHLGTLKVMIPEILLLKGVWEHNRQLWWGSYPLHLGLYLLIGNMALLGLNTLLVWQDIVIPFVPVLILAIAWAGCAIGSLGAIIMLYKRTFDPKLSSFTNPGHFFNIIVLGLIYGGGLWWLATDAQFTQNMADFWMGIIMPSKMPVLSLAAWVHVGSVLFFIFYMPFTHMSHFFTKWFTYHSVRWEDKPNLPGSGIQEKINKNLAQIVTWSAPHIGADGKRNWVDIATMDVPSTNKEKK